MANYLAIEASPEAIAEPEAIADASFFLAFLAFFGLAEASPEAIAAEADAEAAIASAEAEAAKAEVANMLAIRTAMSFFHFEFLGWLKLRDSS